MFDATNGRYDDAIKYFRKAVASNKLDFRAFSSMGAAYLTLAEAHSNQNVQYAGRAIEPLQAAISINPNHAKAFMNLGIAYYLTGSRQQAMINLRKAIEIDPTYDAPFYNMACLYAEEKDTEEALKYLRDAVDRNYRTIKDLQADEMRCFRTLKSDPRFRKLKRSVKRLAAIPDE